MASEGGALLELTDWFGQTSFPAKPWLVLGKGPTFDRRDQFDLSQYNLLALNHVVNSVEVDVAHIIDIDVVADCADHLSQNCAWLLMPRCPHVHSTAGTKRLEEWFDEHPVLREFDERGRLVWYNGINAVPVPGSPVINTGRFSSEAVLRILGRMGAATVRSLGIDGGRSYAQSFKHLEASTLLENAAPGYDVQFTALAGIADEYGIDYRPLVDPLRIFIGADESQVVAYRVLEYSIRQAATIPVEVVPMLDVDHPMPRDPSNRPRTEFSFCRFMIPALCDYRGRALYLDADMLVFGDVAELLDMPFGGRTILTPPMTATDRWQGRTDSNLGAKAAVMLLDCSRLTWDIDEIVAGLDEGRYSYEQLMADLCIVDPDDVGDDIAPEWNDLEHYEPGRTKLLHYTVVPTQPWKNDDNPLGDLWMSWYGEAVAGGAVPPAEVEELIDAGHVKASLRAALRDAPSRRSVLTSASLDLITARRRIEVLEEQIASMKRSSSWRIGSRIVRAFRLPSKLLRSARRGGDLPSP